MGHVTKFQVKVALVVTGDIVTCKKSRLLSGEQTLNEDAKAAKEKRALGPWRGHHRIREMGLTKADSPRLLHV